VESSAEVRDGIDKEAGHRTPEERVMQDLIAAVKAHAIENYEKDGWDFIVECWSDEEIAEAIKGCRSKAAAIKKVGQTARLLGERRSEIQNS
jgi:hypothetical protein